MRTKQLQVASAALVFLGSMALASLPALATGFCTIKKTQDGFVALRAGPSADSRLVARMTSKDEVMLGESQRGSWIEVTWWRGLDRHNKGFDASSGKGWVHKKLIDEECG